MFCPKCGAQNADGSRFCWNCGEPLGTRTSTAKGDRLTLGGKIIGLGSLAALFCFFLPWVSVNVLGMWSIAMSGWDSVNYARPLFSEMLSASPLKALPNQVFLLVPIAAVVILVVLYFRSGRAAARAFALAVVIFLSVVGIVPALLYFPIIDALQKSPGNIGASIQANMGLWGTLAGFLAAFVGAALDIKGIE